MRVVSTSPTLSWLGIFYHHAPLHLSTSPIQTQWWKENISHKSEGLSNCSSSLWYNHPWYITFLPWIRTCGCLLSGVCWCGCEGWTQRFNYLLHLHPFQGSRGAAANLSSHWPRSNRLWTLNRSITQTHIETNNQSHWVNSYSWNNQILVRAQTTALLIVVFLFFLHAIKSPHSQGFKHKDAACGQLCQKKTLPDKGRNEIFFYLIITN